MPTELCVSQEQIEIATLLGSCVAVCLFNRQQGFGGMNHFMLSKTPPEETPSTKYGDYATRMLIKMMLSYDSVIGNLVASIVGGGNVVGHLNVGEDVCRSNITVAEEVLKAHAIPVIRKEVGGNKGRKVYFKSWSGELKVEVIEKQKESLAPKTRILIVDDSEVVRSTLRAAISEDAELEVVGEAEDAYKARELLLELNPDVICLDIIMPKIDGLTFLKKLFMYKPKAVIIISSVTPEGSTLRAQAKSIGAIDVIDKAQLQLFSGGSKIRSVLATKIKAAHAFWVKKHALI